MTKISGQNVHNRALVEIVDIYKTVADIMGVNLPSNDSVSVEGTSLRPLLENPKDETLALNFKDAALSVFPRCTRPGMPVYGM